MPPVSLGPAPPRAPSLMSAPDTGSVARPTAAAANNIQKFRARSPAAPVLKPAAAAAAAAPARPLAPQPGQVVRTLLGAIKSAAPVILGVTAVDLLAPRSANQGEVGWLTRRRAEQFVGDLNDGLGVPQALSRLSAGLFVNDISAPRRSSRQSAVGWRRRSPCRTAPRPCGTSERLPRPWPSIPV